MKRAIRLLGAVGLMACVSAHAQVNRLPRAEGPPTKTTFLRFVGNSNGILVEPVTLDPVRSRIVVISTHPEHVNNLGNSPLTAYGYRTIGVNYYGPEITYEEFLPPIAAAVKAARAIPGVTTVILMGHSTGGPELAFYEDVAENGPKACQEPVRVEKCSGKGLDNLPKADGFIAFDANSGAVDRTIAFDPAVDPHDPNKKPDPLLDSYSPKNGFDPKTNSAHYSEAFKKRFFAAQARRVNQLIDEAEARLKKIKAGKDIYKDDAPFIVYGGSKGADGARLDLADTRLLSATHAPHLLLKADGTRSVEIFHNLLEPAAQPQDAHQLYGTSSTTMMVTARHFLSFFGQRTKPGYGLTATSIDGVEWRGTPSSIQGNVEGVRAPTLVVAATCADHMVMGEITYDHSAAKDKEIVGVEGANHGFQPCKPQYGDVAKRAYDYVDEWLRKPGRFASPAL